MPEGKLEKRACGRFRIPGATVRTKMKRTLFRKEAYAPDVSPLVDMSRGGIRFLTTIKLALDSPVTVKVSIPGEEEPLVLFGYVRWFAPNPDQTYKYQFGVQLVPYGDREGFNPPETLERIIALEQSKAVEREDPDLEA